jgi:hypothetical protein
MIYPPVARGLHTDAAAHLYRPVELVAPVAGPAAKSIL